MMFFSMFGREDSVHTFMAPIMDSSDYSLLVKGVSSICREFRTSLVITSMGRRMDSVLLPFTIFGDDLPFRLDVRNVFLFKLARAFGTCYYLLFSICYSGL